MMLHDMRPAAAIGNAADIAPLDAERIGDRLLCFARGDATANRPNEFICQLCRMMTLAFLFAMQPEVGKVFFSASPAQINQTVICGIPIDMPTFAATRAGTDKGQQYKMMHVPRSAVPAKRNNATTILIVYAGAKLFPIRPDSPLPFQASPYRSVIADSIPRMAGNASVFGHAVRYTTKGPINERRVKV